MMQLRYIKPEYPSAVTFSEEERNEGAEQWKHSLVGYTVGAKPGFMSISNYVSNAWKEFQLSKVYQLKDGVYLFKFDIEEAMKEVLERRWTVVDKFPLVLQQWSPYLDINELPPVESVPIHRTVNGHIEDMGINSCLKSTVLKRPTKKIYSREEMEALRFVDTVEQKKLWSKIRAGLEAAVMSEYDNLAKSKHQKGIYLDFDPRQSLGRKEEAPAIPWEYFGNRDSVLENLEGCETESVDPSDHTCTNDVGEDSFAAVGDCSEDDDSDEDYDSMLKPAFLVEGEPNFDAGPAQDGLEYLRRVRWEAAQLPNVKVVKLEKCKINKVQSIYMPQIPEIASCPDPLLPLKQWEDEFLSDFSELRQVILHLEDTSNNISGKLQPVFVKSSSCQHPVSVTIERYNNLTTDKVNSCQSSLSSATNRTMSPSHEDLSSSETTVGDGSNDYPTLSVIQKLDFVARVSMLRKRISLFETMANLSKKDCAWLFALCAAIDTPLDADTSASLRSLLRKCASLRAEKTNVDDEVIMLNILATISGRYFGQSES
ncbi:hypothetical protein SLE2022_143820 [Rubroshorea leprosula]